MRKFSFIVAACAVLFALTGSSNAQQIYGEYVETRSADVYTGPCFANAEAGLAGDQAILGWRVQSGVWDGVRLDGLSVVAVIKANATLGDPFGNPLPAKAVLIVDEKASEIQRAALIGLAQGMAGELVKNVVRVEAAPISLEVLGHYGKVTLQAGELAGIQTRAIGDKDHLCGNEEVYYQPLITMAHAMPAVAELDRYSGAGLGVSWTVKDKRSAFVGTFSR